MGWVNPIKNFRWLNKTIVYLLVVEGFVGCSSLIQFLSHPKRKVERMGFKHWEEILFSGMTLPTMKLFFLLTSLYLRWKLVEIGGFVGDRSKEVKLFSRSGWNHCTTSREQTSPCLWARETWVLMSEQKGNTSEILRHGGLEVKYTVGLELPVLSMLYFMGNDQP